MQIEREQRHKSNWKRTEKSGDEEEWGKRRDSKEDGIGQMYKNVYGRIILEKDEINENKNKSRNTR